MVSLRDKRVLITNLRFGLKRQPRIIEPKHRRFKEFKKLLPKELLHPCPVRRFPPIRPRDKLLDRPPQVVTPTHQHQRLISLPIHAHLAMAHNRYRIVEIHRFADVVADHSEPAGDEGKVSLIVPGHSVYPKGVFLLQSEVLRREVLR